MKVLIFEIDFDNLDYHYKDKNTPKYVIHCKGPLIIYNYVKNCWISLEKEKIIPKGFQLELNEKLKVNRNYKSQDQLSPIKTTMV